MFKFKKINGRAEAPRVGVVNASTDEATVYIYDAIGDLYGVDANEVVRAMDQISAPRISLRINSPGGDVFAAKAIATAIRNHPAEITAYVDGLAASAATTIAIAADKIVMSPGSFFMIHNPWTLAMGDAVELTKVAEMLVKVGDSIAREYASKTGMDVETVAGMMAAETWMTADEAVAAGFADSIDEGMKAAAMWDLSGFANAPAALTEPAVSEEPEFNIDAMKRRLSMLERIA